MVSDQPEARVVGLNDHKDPLTSSKDLGSGEINGLRRWREIRY
jgi:hypothetical protein